MPHPLSHIRVLDLSRMLAGPWAAQNLADLGAEVIKVETPGYGRRHPRLGPALAARTATASDTRESAYYLSCNRGKKSSPLDIAKPEGQAIVRALAAKCDVLIENYKVGTLARYGLGYEDLRAINPRLVYCSITGFGQTGPYAPRAGYDFVFQGMGGLMSITGERDGVPGGGPHEGRRRHYRHPHRPCTRAWRSLAALAHRDARPAAASTSTWRCSTAWSRSRQPDQRLPRLGRAPASATAMPTPTSCPTRCSRASDGHIILAVGNDSQFASFCTVAGRPELADDARFRLMSGRIVNRDALIPLVAEIMRTRGMHEWIEVLEAANVPCGPINNMQQVFEDPQVQHRGLKVEIPTAAGVPCPTVASPMRFSKTPVEYTLPPPTLGQHTREVLQQLLGMDRQAVDALAAQGIV